MGMEQLVIQHAVPKGFVVENCPTVPAIFDGPMIPCTLWTPGAAAAFEACREPRTLSALTGAMRLSLGDALTEETVLEAVSELERVGLVTVSGSRERLGDMSRRSLLKAAGIAVPGVLSLTAAEQRRFAAAAGSPTSSQNLSA